MVTGVPIDAFAREIGITNRELYWLAGGHSRRLEGEPSMVWECLMGLLNRKLGEIMELRIEVERREKQTRDAKVQARLRRGYR